MNKTAVIETINKMTKKAQFRNTDNSFCITVYRADDPTAKKPYGIIIDTELLHNLRPHSDKSGDITKFTYDEVVDIVKDLTKEMKSVDIIKE
ncbi:MAG: hypothetical protein IKI81_02460 [Selenomonadaceae bacterium]|nr:hypothetical protein [Selenomonadaceae bacterium]MBR6710372.1 hypothetical protein [Selenomonadaceae bacterium]MBR6905836.1 hypothetical protein [Selenomonadaceae bacterium]